jgi:hypothetical protein
MDIFCVAVTLFPHTSPADHVRVMVCGHVPTTFSPNVTGTAPLQPSTAVTVAVAGVGPQFMTKSGGTPLKTGAWVSTTVICCVKPTPFPQASDADHDLLMMVGQTPDVVAPNTMVTPDVPQLSDAVTLGTEGTAPQLTTTLVGKPISTGACVSTTVIICATFDWVPHESAAAHVRVMTLGQAPVVVSVNCRDSNVFEPPQLLRAETLVDGAATLQLVRTLAGTFEKTMIEGPASTTLMI